MRRSRVAQAVRAEQQVAYGRGAAGAPEGLGDEGRALRAQRLLAQIEPSVGEHRARREVEALPGRAPVPQPVEQRRQFGHRPRHHAGHTGGEVLAHHCASR
ncbi:hypothetical protein ABZ953_24880 [Streptomyces sp. NPDC046465]|uniref:hypothetical protein n=1 Tax=Streptomyces sp. NPDC046465 TaxID=3155810 RepID=UPI0033CDBC12